MDELFTSYRDFERIYLPRDYAFSLAKSGEIDELAKYIIDNKLEVDRELVRIMTPKDVGRLFVKISLYNL